MSIGVAIFLFFFGMAFWVLLFLFGFIGVFIVLDPNFYPQGRDKVMEQMLHKKIETRPGFYTPYALGYFGCSEMPMSEKISSRVIMLPSWPGLMKNQIKLC